MMIKKKYIILIILILGLLYMMKDAFMQPGVKDLKGNFKQVAFYRNENNTGPVIRVYAVSLTDTLWKEMQTYGNYMPYNKYGNTKVYFFLEGKPFPDKVYAEDGNFEAKYQKYCIGMYQKDVMSQVSIKKYPYQ